MKYALQAAILVFAANAFAADGQVGIHDPSTLVKCDQKFYPLVRAELRWCPMAPDVIHLSDRYYMYVAANIGAQPKA